MNFHRGRGINRSIFKLTSRLSALKSLITEVVTGKGKFLVKAKSLLDGRVSIAAP